MFFRISFVLRVIFILLFFLSKAQGEIVIDSWSETSTLTKNGRDGQIEIKAHITGLNKNSYHNAFSIIFDPKRQISVRSIKFDNQFPKYSFENNLLKINFTTPKFNTQTLIMGYSFNETYSKIDKYLRQEFISAPPWAHDATAKIILNIPSDMEIASSFGKNIRKENNQLIYEGKISNRGITENIKLTPRNTIWNLKIKNSIIANDNLNYVEAKLPIYFIGGGQRNDNNFTISNPNPTKNRREGNYYILEYKDFNKNKLEITTSAKVYSGNLTRQMINRNPTDYLEVEAADRSLALNLLNEIKNNPDLQGFPPYVQIGRFVHDYLTYDLSYLNKLLSLKDIVEKKRGVCVEYAKLFNILARISGIPSIVVNGIAQGEYDKFEGHSWNMIFYNNQWLQIDPTWDLTSGIVSSSHIYFYDNGTQSIEAKWTIPKDKNPNVNLDTIFEATQTQ